MTTYELRKIREELQQSPRSMADKLGISVHTYYAWERGQPIPKYFALAIRYLTTQDLPKDPSLRRRPMDPLRTRFSPGARFGHLVVIGSALPSGASRHGRVKVRCDCGEEKGVRASTLSSISQCGRYCKLNGTPPPPEEKTAYEPYAAEAPQFIPTPPDPDQPDLDAPEIEWLKYHDRKEKARVAELEAAFDELNDEIAPCDDQPTLEEWEAEWEEGL